MRDLYPDNQLIIFADNDWHLKEKGLPNKGLLKAQEARDAVREGGPRLAVPDFGSLAPSKDASDWNDLVRLIGKDAALEQIGNVKN